MILWLCGYAFLLHIRYHTRSRRPHDGVGCVALWRDAPERRTGIIGNGRVGGKRAKALPQSHRATEKNFISRGCFLFSVALWLCGGALELSRGTDADDRRLPETAGPDGHRGGGRLGRVSGNGDPVGKSRLRNSGSLVADADATEPVGGPAGREDDHGEEAP